MRPGRRIVGPRSHGHFKRNHALYRVVSMYGMAVLFSYFATRKLAASNHTLGLEVWAFLGLIVVAAGTMTVWMIRVGQGGSRQVDAGELPPGDSTPDTAWKAGLIYFNPADPAILVEKRMGLGWTLNFGNRRVWLVVAGLVVPLMILLFTQ